MSPRRLAIVRSALGLQEEEERESSDVEEELGRSSERMALDWVSAVGSTGSLISSDTSADVRGVSMVDEEFMEKELIGGGVVMMSRKRRWRIIEHTLATSIDCCDEVEAKNLLTRKEEGEVVAVSKEMAVFQIVATYTNTTLLSNL
eukprot:scaffold8160_cov144-Skeletonema_dohrnii-CCMP3373.AAC.4